MGCLNSDKNFKHWFGNIHLSGPCNRSCYFCIGQHMMALDPFNNLDKWPLAGFDKFIEELKARNIQEVNLTGTNTEPLLYKHHEELVGAIREAIPNCHIGLRTNAVLALKKKEIWRLYNEASISVTSLNPEFYAKTMGEGEPPDLKAILEISEGMWVRMNTVLCPETVLSGDICDTLDGFADAGIKTVNLREPYGQPWIGNPLVHLEEKSRRFGMPVYDWRGMDVTYWDVHYVEVESVNLYASGRVSMDYPVSRGHAETGIVKDQSFWKNSGRHQQQWIRK